MTFEIEDLSYPDMVMHNGQYVWFDAPHRTSLSLEDFKAPVQRICRYNGAIQWELVRHLALGVTLAHARYSNGTSVASNVAGYFASHDLHECIIGDIVSGLKKHIPNFCSIEHEWETYVHECIGLPLAGLRWPAIVKDLDFVALVTEMKGLGHPGAEVARLKLLVPEDTTNLNQRCFEKIQSLSLDECWDIVVDAIQTEKDSYFG